MDSLLKIPGRKGKGIINLTGMRVGRLVVLGHNKEKKGKTGQNYWDVICDCGNKKVALGMNLRNAQTKSCGCIVKENARLRWQKEAIKRREKYGYANAKTVYNSKRKAAIKKGVLFEIPFEDWVKIAASDCYYCGKKPEQLHSNKSRQNYGHFKFNGLDRIIPKEPYIIGNVIPCCWDCNKAKSGLSQSDFYELIKKIYFNRVTK